MEVSNDEDFEISGLAHTDADEEGAADGKDSLQELLHQVRSPLLSPPYSYRIFEIRVRERA